MGYTASKLSLLASENTSPHTPLDKTVSFLMGGMVPTLSPVQWRETSLKCWNRYGWMIGWMVDGQIDRELVGGWIDWWMDG